MLVLQGSAQGGGSQIILGVDLWGYPLQGVCKFKTVFTIILTCCLLFLLLTFALSVVKLLVPYHESRHLALNCMALKGENMPV